MTKEKTGNSVQSSDTEKKRKSNDKNTGIGKNNSLSTARRDRLKRKKTAGKVDNGHYYKWKEGNIFYTKTGSLAKSVFQAH